MGDFTGKTAFVTGAASGIGLALAKRFLAAGANVMLADISAPALAQAAETLGAGAKARTVVCDVANALSVQGAADATVDAFGKVHVVVNNAGVSLAGLAGQTPLEDWNWIVNINLMGVVHGVEVFTPLLKAHGEGGYFVNTASMAGHVASPALGPYNATKFAVVGYSETLRQDFEGSDIGVSVLCPGWVKTGINKAYENRPSGVKEDEPVDPNMAAAFAAVESGIAPEKVADWTLECMAANRFYIFTHPQLRPFMDARAAVIAADMQACAQDPKFQKPQKT